MTDSRSPSPPTGVAPARPPRSTRTMAIALASAAAIAALGAGVIATAVSQSADASAPSPPAAAAVAGPIAAPPPALTKALAADNAVVVVVHIPGATLDDRVVREARAAAELGSAGFLAVDAGRSGAVRPWITAFALRDTPSVLVVARGPRLVNLFAGYADRQVIAQAAVAAR